MKSFNIFLVLLLVLVGCRPQEKQVNKEENSAKDQEYAFVGKEFDISNAQKASEMATVYSDLSTLDTVSTKFSAKVIEVCQAKGCWMKVALEDGNEAMVKFKDYGFFVPKDLAGREVLMNGLAFVEETSIEDLQHLAKDAGKSQEEISAITQKEKTNRFEADGVLIVN